MSAGVEGNIAVVIGAGAGDNTLLQWFDFVADRTDRLPVLGQGAWLLSSRGDAALAVSCVLFRAAFPTAAYPYCTMFFPSCKVEEDRGRGPLPLYL